MYKKLPSLVLLGLFAGAAQAQTTIDFDTAPGGAPVSDQQVVETTYSGVGVFFDVEDCLAGGINKGDIDDDCEVIAAAGTDAASSPNTVTISVDKREPEGADKGGDVDCDAFSEGDGVIRADFSVPVVMASILAARDDSDDPAYLRAYNDAGALIDEDLLPASGPEGVYTELEVQGDMAFVRFAGINGDTVCFDDLVLTTGARTIPTMNTWGMAALLLALSVITLLVLRRRART